MNKKAQYNQSLKEIQSIWDEQISLTGNLANVCAVLKSTFDFWWVGFYRVESDVLQLHVFQGPTACTRIGKGKGVCGAAWERGSGIVVPNVHEFDGHIACNSESNSEIVIPVKYYDSVWGVLDIDSKQFNIFDEVDKICLEEIVGFLEDKITSNIPC
ncbi:MAG: GAF domain-containing protein [Bacteroidia bacterium]|nr:GAF domain-containing protein [Bacteroidia bacterium]